MIPPMPTSSQWAPRDRAVCEGTRGLLAPPRLTGPRGRHRERGDTPGSFGQTCFPKPLNHQPRLRLPATSDPCGYCKGGIDLEHTRRRFVRLGVTSEMGEGGRETAVGSRKGGVLT